MRQYRPKPRWYCTATRRLGSFRCRYLRRTSHVARRTRSFMAIEGPLKELGLHDVFQLLDLSRKTGVMRVTSHLRNNEGTVAFDGGAIVFAEIRSNPLRIG